MVLFLKAGIHPTIAGVILGFSIPAEGNCKVSMLHQWEKRLHPWSAYLIMPVFALSNAGVEISLASLDFTSPSPGASWQDSSLENRWASSALSTFSIK